MIFPLRLQYHPKNEKSSKDENPPLKNQHHFRKSNPSRTWLRRKDAVKPKMIPCYSGQLLLSKECGFHTFFPDVTLLLGNSKKVRHEAEKNSSWPQVRREEEKEVLRIAAQSREKKKAWGLNVFSFFVNRRRKKWKLKMLFVSLVLS